MCVVAKRVVLFLKRSNICQMSFRKGEQCHKNSPFCVPLIQLHPAAVCGWGKWVTQASGKGNAILHVTSSTGRGRWEKK